MKSRIALVLAISLLILGIALFTFFTRNQEPGQVFPATVKRDCAPWDGIAFTVFIPYGTGSSIYISIWQSPDAGLPVTFRFPDDTLRLGTATYVLQVNHTEQLTGSIFFWNIQPGSPVEGTFDFVTESGQQLKGKFEAKWGNEVVYCG